MKFFIFRNFHNELKLSSSSPHYLFNADHQWHLDGLGEEEVFGKVAAKGLEAALVVQQLLPHQSGHTRCAVDPKQIADRNGCQHLGEMIFIWLLLWICSPVEIHPRMKSAKKYFFKRRRQPGSIANICNKGWLSRRCNKNDEKVTHRAFGGQGQRSQSWMQPCRSACPPSSWSKSRTPWPMDIELLDTRATCCLSLGSHLKVYLLTRHKAALNGSSVSPEM